MDLPANWHSQSGPKTCVVLSIQFPSSDHCAMLLRLWLKWRPKFFDRIGHHVILYTSSGNKHFFTKKFHCKTLPKLWTTSSNISKFWFSKSIFSVENWSTLSKKIKKYLNNVGLLDQLLLPLLALFMILVGLTVTLFCEKMLISTKCTYKIYICIDCSEMKDNF